MIKNGSKYKPTGNLAVDMVGACITHSEQFRRKVTRIILQPKYWNQFSDYVRQSTPDYLFEEEVDFDGVMIVKGSSLMIVPLYVERQEFAQA
jgi:hypothetical protein